MAEGIVWTRRILKIAVLGALAWLCWTLTFGNEKSRKLQFLDAERRLLHHRIELLKYWDVNGALPEFLDDTMTIWGASPVTDWNRYFRGRGKQCVDPWDEAIGYARDADGTGYELRSAGPDEAMNTADDLVLRGRSTDDRKAVYEEYRVKAAEYDRLAPRSRTRKRTDF